MLSDVLFFGWMISGTLLSLILLIPTKDIVTSSIFGFMLAPFLPVVIVYAIIAVCLEESAQHQAVCKYKINSAGPNCGTACQCVWSIGGQRQHYSTKSKQQSIEKCILNVALYECMQRRCYPVWNCVPRRITPGTSFGADELQRIIKNSPDSLWSRAFCVLWGLRSRITGDVVIFRQIYPKNREIKEQTLKS